MKPSASGAIHALALATMASLAWMFREYTMDDAYITIRYATNFAEGYGLVFNRGEYPRAEGLTSPVHALLLSAAVVAGMPAIIWGKLLGAAAYASASYIVARVVGLHLSAMGASARRASMTGAAAAVVIASNPYLAGNAVSGMETALGCASASLLLWQLSRAVLGQATQSSSILALGGSAVLVPLFRPEMTLWVVCMMALCAAWCSAARRTVMRGLLVMVALGCLYFSARYAYYGLLLPLPFYVKQGVFQPGTWKPFGVSPLKAYLLHVAPLLPFAAAAAAHVARSSFSLPWQGLIAAVCASTALQLAYYGSIRHIMGFGHRYFAAVSMALLVLAVVGLEIARQRTSRAVSVALPAVALVLVLSGNALALGPAHGLFVEWYGRRVERGLVIAAEAFRDAATEGPVRMALNNCGAIPLVTGFEAVDLGGLNNRAIALGRTREATVAEVRRAAPAVVLLVSRRAASEADLYGWENLEGSDVKSLGYGLRGSVPFGAMMDGTDLHLLVYSDHTAATTRYIDRLSRTHPEFVPF